MLSKAPSLQWIGAFRCHRNSCEDALARSAAWVGCPPDARLPSHAMDETVVYPARRIITMNRGLPFAEAVAVRDARILGVGTVAELESWGPCRVDDRFAEGRLMQVVDGLSTTRKTRAPISQDARLLRSKPLPIRQPRRGAPSRPWPSEPVPSLWTPEPT